MFDAMLPFRLAQAATELAMRNATLAMSFWNVGGLPSSWAVSPAAAPAIPHSGRTVRSWYRHPDTPSTPIGMPVFGMPVFGMAGFNPFAAGSPFMGMPFSPAAALQPWMSMMKAGGAGSCMMPAIPAAAPLGSMPWLAPMQASMQAPMQAWMRMWSQAPTGMTAGPMALALMAFGMPQAAAWPTAEAGAHAMVASRKAAEGVEQMFSTYRSDGGHAIAQIIFGGRRLH